jgi:c-di-GMP-binding flagellar brake protein YcgR
MDVRRKFSRVPIELKAQYHLKGEEDWKECTVIDISRNGMGIKFLTREKIDVGSTIHLEIFLHEKPKLINVKGILKWIKPRENDFIGGIEVTLLTREGR